MPIRTTTVVAVGLAALALIGVGTIFGESLAALVAPPPATDGPGAHAAAGPTPNAVAPAPSAGPAVRGGDGGVAKGGSDGSS